MFLPLFSCFAEHRTVSVSRGPWSVLTGLWVEGESARGSEVRILKETLVHQLTLGSVRILKVHGCKNWGRAPVKRRKSERNHVKRDIVLVLARARGPLRFWITSRLRDSRFGGAGNSWVTPRLVTQVWEQMKWMRGGCEDVTVRLWQRFTQKFRKAVWNYLIAISVAKYQRAGLEWTRIYSGYSNSSYCTSLPTMSDPSFLHTVPSKKTWFHHRKGQIIRMASLLPSEIAKKWQKASSKPGAYFPQQI